MTVLLALWIALAGQPQRWEDPHLRAAADYVEQKNFAKAAEILQAVIDAEPQCRPQAYVELAKVRLQLGGPAQAIGVYEQGLKAHPDSAELLKRYGQLLFRKNRIEPRAGELFGKAAKAAPNDAEAHYLYGEWSCMNNLEETCIAELARAAALPESNGQAKMQIYTLTAIAEDKLNRADRADAAFRKALAFNLSLEQPNPVAMFEYVKFLAKESRDAEAQKLIADLLKLAPQFGPAHLERAKYFGQQDQHEKAAESAELALRYAGDDRAQQRAAHVFLARTYYALGREDQAKVHQAWVQAK